MIIHISRVTQSANIDVRGQLLSQRIEKSWLVFISIENDQHDRCVDLFERPDGTCGFEHFRRDPEDGGVWTPLSFHSVGAYPDRRGTLLAAIEAVAWLDEAVESHDGARRLLTGN